MKTKHLAIAAVVLASGVAHAQSSVTLYGIIDTSILYQNNVKGSSNWFENSGTSSTSRWGLRGTEDLGGGLSAVFDLENGFMANNGTLKNGGDLFGRQAWVGLNSKQYGQLTVGRQYDFLVDYVAPMSTTGSGFAGNLGAHPYDNDNLDNDMRLNNSVKFSSASFHGLKAGAIYGFSNEAGGFANNRAYGFGAAYARGPLSLAAAYLQINRSTTMANATGSISTGDGNELTLGGNQQIWAAGAKYSFGKANIGMTYSHSVTYNITGLFGQGLTGQSMKFDNFDINGQYFVRPDLSLNLGYTYTTGTFAASTGSATPHWNQVTAMVDYNLSRRTDVYLIGSYQRVSGGNAANALNGGGTVFNASVYNYGTSSTNAQVVAGAGLRHRF
jgi:general bacterial porin, GBP family